jgi:hypothetical protein
VADGEKRMVPVEVIADEAARYGVSLRSFVEFFLGFQAGRMNPPDLHDERKLRSMVSSYMEATGRKRRADG